MGEIPKGREMRVVAYAAEVISEVTAKHREDIVASTSRFLSCGVYS